MTEKEASQFLRSLGIFHSSAKLIPEGANHFIFDVTLSDGDQGIARFTSGRQSKIDNLFGGLLSVKREEANMLAVCRAGLPAPAVIHSSGEFLLVEKMPGLLWSEYLQKNNHTAEWYLRSLTHLGESIALLQLSTSKTTFGDAHGEVVTGKQRAKFNERLIDILNHRLLKSREVFSVTEFDLINNFLRGEISQDCSEKEDSVLVMSDMHPMNFLVDDNGQPTGFFDLEACQYAHPALEMYGIRLFLFNYYSNVPEAEKRFFEGYAEAGGSYNPSLSRNIALENVLGIMRLLELAISYNNVKDGMRDNWSDRFKQLLFESIEEGTMKWCKAAEILREKTQQPLIAHL